MSEITTKEVKSLVDIIGPHIDSRFDFTYEPLFAKARNDVCAVRRMAENGTSYGYDTIYLLWKSKDVMSYEKIADSMFTKDYIYIDDIFDDGKDIVVKYSSGGSFSGTAWDKEYRKQKKELGLE